MSPVTIRPLIESERNAYYRLALITFSTAEDVEQRSQRWRWSVENSPDYDPIQVRGAFRDQQFLGGYIIHERTLAIGPSRLLTGCISAVVTHPDHRLQGVASAMLRDAVQLAQARGHALLLLDGIPNFYHRFGFTGVMSDGGHAIQMADILALPPSPCQVRAATSADADDLLRLYHQEFDPFPGVFARTPAIQQHQLAVRLPGNPPLLAVDERGRVKGYLLLPWTPGEASAYEVVAEDWDAASALLQHHAHLLAAGDPAPSALSWLTPPGSATFYALADHIRLQTALNHLPAGDWMARSGHLPTFMKAMSPHWRERRQRSTQLWNGPIQLDLGEATLCLDFDGAGVQLSERPCAQAPLVRLTLQALTHLSFGFRPAWWLARQPGNDIPDPLIDVLQTLAPAQPGWVPGSDRF